MSKIKNIIEKMQASGTQYSELSLLVAKRVWLIIASLYYLAFLFTVGGFYFGPVTLDQLSMATFHLYSILVVISAWFFYSLCEYGITIYLPTRRWILIIAMILSLAFAVVALLAHLGII
jgi:hypothetical protein